MSTTSIAVGSRFGIGRETSSGLSEDNRAVRALAEQVLRHLRTAISGEPFQKTIDDIVELHDDCSENNWDGYGAEPVAGDTIEAALRLVSLLPSSVAEPDVSPEPDGSIGLEWRTEGNRFAISIDGGTLIAFSGIFADATRRRGVERLVETIPDAILELLVDRFRRWPPQGRLRP